MIVKLGLGIDLSHGRHGRAQKERYRTDDLREHPCILWQKRKREREIRREREMEEETKQAGKLNKPVKLPPPPHFNTVV